MKDNLRCIFEFKECINELNCTVCSIARKYWDEIKSDTAIDSIFSEIEPILE